MADQNRPPPTRPADGDGYEHRRRSDPPQRSMIHTRWYDSTKVQLAIGATIFGLIMGSMAIGYTTRDRLRMIDEIPVREQQFLDVNTSQWTSINRNTEAIATMRRQIGDMSAVNLEILCIVSAETPRQRSRCQSEQTRRRIQDILTQ
jgi:hypothetical protein